MEDNLITESEHNKAVDMLSEILLGTKKVLSINPSVIPLKSTMKSPVPLKCMRSHQAKWGKLNVFLNKNDAKECHKYISTKNIQMEEPERNCDCWICVRL